MSRPWRSRRPGLARALLYPRLTGNPGRQRASLACQFLQKPREQPVSESIDAHTLTLTKASPGNGGKPGKTDTSANGRGFAAVLDQQRSSPAGAARGDHSGPAAGGKAMPAGRQGAAAEAAADADRPADDSGTPPGDEMAGDGAAGSDAAGPPGVAPATAAQVDTVAEPALSDRALVPGGAGRGPGTETDPSATAATASRPAAGALSAEPAPAVGSASPAPSESHRSGAGAPSSEARVAGAQVDVPAPVPDALATGETTAGLRRAIGDASDLPQPGSAAEARAPGAGNAGMLSAAMPGPTAASLTQIAEAAPAEAGESPLAGPVQRGDSPPSQVLSVPAGMTPATAAAPPPGEGAPPMDADALVLDVEAAPEDAEFPREMSSRVSLMLRDGSREARLQLHPAELGRVQVTINTDGDQARVVFVAESAAAREAIEQAMPRLREALAQQGMELAQADVGQQGARGDDRSGWDDPVRTGLGSAEGQPAEAETADDRAVTLRASSRLDLYA